MNNIINFQDASYHKKAEIFASKVTSDALNLDLKYDITTLEILMGITTKIAYFSGDVEGGKARTTKLCEPSQLLRAATHLRYSFELSGFRLRLVFDGDYLYDVYLDERIDVVTLEQLEKALKAQSKVNFSRSEQFQKEFEGIMQNAYSDA